MNTIERRQYEMLVRVRDFGDNHGHLFPGSSVARENVTAVAAAIQELDTQDLRHMAASASALLEQKTRTRDALLARLQAIGQTARVLARNAPGLDEQFPVPDQPTDQQAADSGTQIRARRRTVDQPVHRARHAGDVSSPICTRSWTPSIARCAIAAWGARRAAPRAPAPRRHCCPDWPPSAASTPSSSTICATTRRRPPCGSRLGESSIRSVEHEPTRRRGPGRRARDAEPAAAGAAPESPSGNKAA